MMFLIIATSPSYQTQQTWFPGRCRPHSNSQHPPAQFGREKEEMVLLLYTLHVYGDGEKPSRQQGQNLHTSGMERGPSSNGFQKMPVTCEI